MDNLGILVQAILSLKDTKASKDQIASELPKLESQLQSDKNTRVKIVAGLDIAKSKNLIQSQLNTLANQAKAPTIKIGIDTSGLNSVQGATQNITNNLKNVQTQAQNTTQSIINLSDKFKAPIKPVFNKEGLIDAEKTILRVQQHFQELGEISVKGQYGDKNAVDSLDTMIVKIQNGQKEARTLTFELDKAGKAFYLKSGTSDNSGVAKLSTQIEETRVKYNRLLSDFKSSNSAIQSGLTQPIQQFETVLNGLGKTSSINDVKNAFEALKQSASEITKYLDTTNSSFNKATNAVNNYKNMDNILKEMTASFNNLVMKPENLRTELDGVKSKLVELQNLEKTEGGYTKAWAEKYREVNLELAQVKTNIELALKAEGSSQKADKNSAYQTQLKYLNKIKEETNTIISLKRKMVNAGDEEKAVYQHEITNAQKRIQYDVQQLDKKKLLTDEAKRLVNTYKEQIALQDKINSAKTSDKNVQAQSQQLKDYVTQISKAITQLNSLQNSPTFTKNASNSQVTQTKQEIASLITAYQNLMTKLQGNITPVGLETVRTELTQLNARFNTATATAKQFETELRNDNGAEKLAQRVALLKAQLEALAKANPKAMTRFGNEINSLMATLNNSPDARAVDQVTKSVQLLRREINNADLAGKTFFQNLKEKAAKFTGWMSMTYAISLFTRSVRQAVVELKDIDTILTEISKTSDRTEASLRRLGDTSFATASKYGQKASDYLLGVQEMSRAGFDEKASEQMAELSTLAQSAGDMTAELANEYLIATNAGYKLGGSAEKLNAVLNSQNYITNRNALNMSELAEATKIVASQASQSGIGIDKMTAAVGTMIATTQQGGEVAARAFKGKRTLCTIALYGCESIVA